MPVIRFTIDDPSLQKVFDAAVEKSRLNLKDFQGRRVLVEGGGYEKIWLETQPMGGEMYAGFDMECARNNILFFLDYQRADGRMPGSIYCPEAGPIEPQFNKFQGFCFPWHALNLYYLMGEDRDYLDALASGLEKLDRYLWTYRDSDGDGCLESFCVYDTGEDNAVRFGNAPVYWTENDPPRGFDTVPMASMDVMSWSYACRDTLAQICRIRGEQNAWAQKADAVREAMKQRLWHEDRGACYDRAPDGHVLPQLVHNNLRCMYWGSFSPDMAKRFVSEHLLNPREFWTPMPLPSVSVSDPDFRNAPENNWSGQCEGLTYQRAILALERYGFDALVPRLGRALFSAVGDHGMHFVQQYDPFTGAPSLVSQLTHQVITRPDEPVQDAYGPTILATLEYFAHMWGVDLEMGQAVFRAQPGPCFRYTREHLGHVYELEGLETEAVARLDGYELKRFARGHCLRTDMKGNILGLSSISGSC